MVDEALRDLERRWRATGTVEDEAAYLAHRVRIGELTADQVDLAATYGYPAARRARSRAALDPLIWGDELAALPLRDQARVSLALGRFVLATIRSRPELFVSFMAVDTLERTGSPLGHWEYIGRHAARVLAGLFSESDEDDFTARTVAKVAVLYVKGRADRLRHPCEQRAEEAMAACLGWSCAAPEIGRLDARDVVRRVNEFTAAALSVTVSAALEAMSAHLLAELAPLATGRRTDPGSIV